MKIDRTRPFEPHLGRNFCQGCSDLVKAPLGLSKRTGLPQKRTQKVLCRRTGFMPGHMKTCPKGVNP
jgi:hypothetical protein